MRLVLAMVLAGLVALPLSVSAQDAEEESGSRLERWHPEAFGDPSKPAEPATEEPALQLKVDDAGVVFVPPPPRTSDGYTLEEMKRRVSRARAGLGVSAVALVAGTALAIAGGVGTSCLEPCSPEPSAYALIATGAVLVVGGVAGGVVFGNMRADRERQLRELQQARYERPRRVQWDLARSRLVF